MFFFLFYLDHHAHHQVINLNPRKISADDAAALTFGAGGRTVERIQRVSEAEVEHLWLAELRGAAGGWRISWVFI